MKHSESLKNGNMFYVLQRCLIFVALVLHKYLTDSLSFINSGWIEMVVTQNTEKWIRDSIWNIYNKIV